MDEKRKRRRYFIQKTFQLKLILFFMLLIGAGAIISGSLLYVLASSELTSKFSSAHLVIHNSRDMLLPSIIITHVTAVVLIALFTVILVLFFSHRIAGPLYRLEMIANNVGRGDLTVKVTFRKNDELAPLKSSFQAMIDSLHAILTNVKNANRELSDLIPVIENAIQSSTLTDDNKKSLMSTIKNCIANSTDSLQNIQL